MLLSVVIPTCDRIDLLSKCLSCLAPGNQVNAENIGLESYSAADESACFYEVIVTDDGSQTSANEMLRRNFPWAKWIQGPKWGSAGNRNNGAKLAQGKWIVFTDDDCLPDPSFLFNYWSEAIKGEAQVFEGMTSPAGVRTRVDMDCPVNQTGGYLWSCNMCIDKDLFFEVGGFDADLGSAMEDIDLRTRLVKAGEPIKFVPRALVLHPWRRKKGYSFCRHYSESMGYFVAKHPESGDLVSLPSLGVNLARKLLWQLPPIVLACRGRGLVRELMLTVYNTYVLMVYARRSARQTSPHG